MDYKLVALWNVDRSYKTAFDALKTTKLRPVATAFVKNVDRILSVGALPMRLTHLRVHSRSMVMLPPADLLVPSHLALSAA
jgi:hypothetical protein